MSLIMDALRKAQQFRLKEPKETPSPTRSPSRHQRVRRASGQRWIVVGLAFLVLFSLYIFWQLFLSPLPPLSTLTTARLEKKSPAPGAREKSEQPSGGVLTPELIEGLKDAVSLPKDVSVLPRNTLHLSGDVPGLLQAALSFPKDEKPKIVPSISSRSERVEKTTPPIKEKKEEPPLKKAEVPPSPALPKEQTPARPFEVRREGEKEHPMNSEILTQFNLGIQRYNQRDFSKAIQAYQRVIELDPRYVEAYNNLGIIYQEMKDFDRAFDAYQKSVEINPRYEKGYNNLGILFYLKGRNEEALEAFQKALAINNRNIESHINLGVLFKKQGQLNKAIESYRKALEISPFHRESHFNLALLYEQMENLELAIDHYQHFIMLSSTSPSDLVPKVQRHLEDLMKSRNQEK